MSGATRTDAMLVAALRVGAVLQVLVELADERSRTQRIVAGLLLAGAAVALVHLTGATVPAGLGGGPPHLADYALRGLSTRAPSVGG